MPLLPTVHLLLLLLLALLLPPHPTAASAVPPAPTTVTIHVGATLLHTVDPRELSFTYDVYALNPAVFSQTQRSFDLASSPLRAMAKALGPSVLRVSGTGIENAQLEGDAASGSFVPLPPPAVRDILRPGGGGTNPFNVTRDDWKQVAAFAAAMGSDLVLGLNQLTRTWPGDALCHAGDAAVGGARGGAVGVGGAMGVARGEDAGGNAGRTVGTLRSPSAAAGGCPWVSRNARAWMEFNRDAGIKVLGYELGNEPGCYMDLAGSHSTGIAPADAAADFRALKVLIADVYGNTSNANTTSNASLALTTPLVMGPDVGGCKHADQNAEILAAGAAGGSSNVYDVLTFQ